MQVKERAQAKVNLTLSVQGKRDDGYHHLLSLVAFTDLADELEIFFGKKTELIVEGAFAQSVPTDESNLIIRALEFLRVEAQVRLIKNIPCGAGLGGGSADCAAIVRAAVKHKQGKTLTEPIAPSLLALGSDVPACFLSRNLWLSGVGEVLSPVTLPKLFCVLASPQEPSSTKDVFAAFDKNPAPARAHGEAHKQPEAFNLKELFNFCRTQGNDLTPFVPQSQSLLAALSKLSPAPAAFGMSGSGSACFALYQQETQAKAAERTLKEQHQFWVESAIMGG